MTLLWRSCCTPTVSVLLILLFVGCASNDAPAPPPSTDVYLTSYTVTGDSLRLDSLANWTDRPGYDNQPQFTPDGNAFLYTSERDGQTDIYRWPLDANAPHPLTATATSEYSPTPHTDSTFVVVRVEDDGAQRLWQFSMQDAEGLPSEGTLLFPDVEPVGYFAAADAIGWALFVLSEPPTLQWVTHDGESAPTVVRQDIGRSIQTHPDGNRISAVQRHESASDSVLIVRNPNDVATYAPALEGEGDHVWTRSGHLLMTSGTTLYQWHPEAASWRAVHDWAPATPSRLAVSPTENQLAVVVALPESE